MPVNTQLVVLTEATRTGATLTRVPGSKRWRAKIIEGDRLGSSGYYSREVLERDAGVFSVGLHSFLDHPGLAESGDRPERSVRDLAGKLTTTAVYDGDGLYAEIEFFPHFAPIIEAMAGDVGLSIRASGMVESREVDGRMVPYVTALTEAVSVDVVTRAGAGGKLVQLLEAARPLREGHGLTANDLRDALGTAIEDTYDRARYSWVQDYSDEWVVFTLAVPEIDGDCEYRLYQQTYSVTDGAVTLTGTAVEVTAHTTYTADGAAPPPAGAPVVAPATATAVAETVAVTLPAAATVSYSTSGSVDQAQLREAVHRALVPNTITPGYVYTPPKNVTAGAPPPAPTPTLEESMETKQTGAPAPVGAAGQAEVTEAATPADPQIAVLKERLAESQARESALSEAQQQKKIAEARADQAVAETRSLRANDTARSVIAAKLTESAIDHQVRPLFLPRVNAAVLGRVPLTEAGEVDGDKLDAVVIAAIEAERVYAAQILEAAGHGSVAGLGSHSAGRVVSDADVTAGLTSVFESIGMSGKTAELAAKGRF